MERDDHPVCLVSQAKEFSLWTLRLPYLVLSFDGLVFLFRQEITQRAVLFVKENSLPQAWLPSPYVVKLPLVPVVMMVVSIWWFLVSLLSRAYLPVVVVGGGRWNEWERMTEEKGGKAAKSWKRVRKGDVFVTVTKEKRGDSVKIHGGKVTPFCNGKREREKE